MSDNPWKKQAEANKAAVGNKGPPGTGTVPPWMKPKTEQPQQPVQPTQPQQQSLPVPAIKPQGTSTAGVTPGGNNAPWAKPNGSTQAQQSNAPKVTAIGQGGTSAGNPTGGSVPPWMKNKQTSPIGTDRKMQEQKQHEEELARLKKIKQQEQERARKLEQLKEEKERKQMYYEQQYSQIREEEDRKKKKNVKNNAKSSPNKFEPKRNQAFSQKSPNQSTSFHKYLACLTQSCSKQEEYRERLEHQKEYVEVTFKYAEQIKKNLVIYLQERRMVQRKKSVINLENMVVEYALVEGINNEADSWNLQPYFKTKNVQYLQQKFGAYCVLYSAILRLLKKSSLFRLRVPLLCRASYKGIEFLCEAVCDELLDCVLSPVENFVQLQGELMQLEKQLRDLGHDQLNRKILTVKKICANNEEVYILYLMESFDNLVPKHNFGAPNNSLTVESIINLSLISSRKLELTYTNMKIFSQIRKGTTQKLQESYLNLFQIAHAIRIVYASCQGEVDQQSFWSLVFNDNTEIWALIRGAYAGVYLHEGRREKIQAVCSMRNKFLLAKILSLMIPITFGVCKEKTILGTSQQIKKKPMYLDSKFELIAYPTETMQIFEICQLYDKTIENPNKVSISEDAQRLQEEINQISGDIYVRTIDVFVNKNNLKFRKAILANNLDMMAESISAIENYQFGKGHDMEKLVIYPLLMKFYMQALELGINPMEMQRCNDSHNQDHETTSNRFQKSKLEQSEVKQVYFSSQAAKKQETRDLHEKNHEDFQTKLINIFRLLLAYVEELFENQKQVWIHAELYMVLAAYYSKPRPAKMGRGSQQGEKSIERESDQRKLSYFNKQPTLPKQRGLSKSQSVENWRSVEPNKKNSQAQSLAEEDKIQEDRNEEEEKIQHPYRKQCMKFVQLSHRICLQFYGSHSPHMAQFLYHEAEIYYNINQLDKSQASVQEALKIYRASSKNSRNAINCSIILGKSLVHRGKVQKDNKILQKGIEILENTAEELFNLGMENKVIQIYQYLCANSHFISREKPSSKTSGDASKTAKIQQYLEKMADLSFAGKNIDFLKKVIKKAVESEVAFYSKEKAIVLRELHRKFMEQNIPQEEEEREKLEREEENLVYLRQNRQNFGGLLELIKWSFSILKSKGESIQLTRATEIMEKILGFFTQRQILQMLTL